MDYTAPQTAGPESIVPVEMCKETTSVQRSTALFGNSSGSIKPLRMLNVVCGQAVKVFRFWPAVGMLAKCPMQHRPR